MADLKVGDILNQLEAIKDLDYNSSIFYNYRLENARKGYMTYSNIVKNNDFTHYMEAAKEYREKSKNYQELLIMAKYHELFEASHNSDLEKQQKSLLSENLKLLYEAMEKSGIISLFIYEHNSICDEEKLEALKVSKQQVEDEFNFERNMREKTPILYLKNAFWLNRYKRTLSNLYLQEKFKKVAKKSYGDKDLYYLMYMHSCKNEILKQIFKEAILHEDIDNTATEMCKQYEDDYKRIFGGIFKKSQNDIYSDYKDNYEFEIVKASISNKRHVLLEMLLKHQIMEPAAEKLYSPVKYWGIYEKKDMYVLGLEPEGYILPANFYVPKYVYADILTSLNMSKYKFSEYTPLKSENGRILKIDSGLMVKPTLEQLKEIKLQSKKNATLKRSLEQINGRAHSHTVPNTLEVEIGDK